MQNQLNELTYVSFPITCITALNIVLRFAALFQAMLDLCCFDKEKNLKNADHYLNFHGTFQVLLCFPLC